MGTNKDEFMKIRMTHGLKEQIRLLAPHNMSQFMTEAAISKVAKNKAFSEIMLLNTIYEYEIALGPHRVREILENRWKPNPELATRLRSVR